MDALTVISIVLIVIIVVLIIASFIRSCTIYRNEVNMAAKFYKGDTNKAKCFINSVYGDGFITTAAKANFYSNLQKVTGTQLTADNLLFDNMTTCDSARILSHYTQCL